MTGVLGAGGTCTASPRARPPPSLACWHRPTVAGGGRVWGEAVLTPTPGIHPQPELQDGRLELATAPSLSVPVGLPQPCSTHPSAAQPWVPLKPKERRGGHERAPAGFIAQLGRGVQPGMGGQPGLWPPPCPTVAPTLRPQVLPSTATPQGKPASALHHPLLPPAPASSLHCPQHRATGTASISAPSPLTAADIIIPSSPAGADPQPPTAPHSSRAPCPTTLTSVDKGSAQATCHVQPRTAMPRTHPRQGDWSASPSMSPSAWHPSARSARPRHYATVRSRTSSLVHPCICPFPASGSQTSEAVSVELSSSVVRIRYSCASVSLRCCADCGSERVRRAGAGGSRLSSPGRDAGLSTGSSGSESSDVELPLLPGAARGAGSWLVRGEPAQRSERLRLWLRGPGEVGERSWGKLASDLDLSALAGQGRSCTGVRRRSRGEAGRGAGGAGEGSCPSSAVPSGCWPKSRREAGESVP